MDENAYRFPLFNDKIVKNKLSDKKNICILVSGPYGGLNLGDDAIGKVICSQLRERGMKVVLAAKNRQMAKKIFNDISVVEWLDVRGAHFSVLKTMRECDGVLVGGGEQIYEPRIPNPIWGHLATNAQLGFLSKLFNKKFAVFGVGVDSCISRLGQYTIKKAFSTASFIGVRDIDSRKRLLSILGDDKEVYLGADPVFLMSSMCKKTARRKLEEEYGVPAAASIVIIMPSLDKINSTNYITKINGVTKLLIENGVWVLYAITDLQSGYDLELYKKSMLYEHKRAFWIEPGKDGIDGINMAIAGADCVVSSRMHPLIFSLVQKTPFVCLARSAKMQALMDMLEISSYFNIDDFLIDDLMFAIDVRLRQGSDEFLSRLEGPLFRIKQRARDQFDMVVASFY